MMKLEEIVLALRSEKTDKEIEVINVLKGKDAKFLKTHENLLLEVSSPWLVNNIKDLVNASLPTVNSTVEILSSNDFEVDLKAIKSLATHESIGQIIHELSPIIGSINLYAEKEVEDFENSKLKIELGLLDEVIDTFEDWRSVEKAPKYNDVNVYNIAKKEGDRCMKDRDTEITLNLSKDLSFLLDRSYLRIILSNAFRNAYESIDEVKDRLVAPIVVSGGVSDKGLWVSVIDNGIGIQQRDEITYKSLHTTKPGHNGFGLPIINKAIEALGGDWRISNGVVQGAEFFMQIPFKVL